MSNTSLRIPLNVALTALLTLGFASNACSGKTDAAGLIDPEGGTNRPNGTGASNGTGDAPNQLDLGGSTNLPATGGAAAVGEACATDTLKAERAPVNMFIQFDRSGSMNESNKWPQAAGALNAFFKDPSTAGLNVALRFFPDDAPVPGCTRDATVGMACDVAACSTPLVNLGQLLADAAPADAHEQKLLDAVAASGPPVQGVGDGGTPMYAALVRSPLSGWTAAVGVPVAELEATAAHAVALTAGTLLCAVALACLGALLFARRLLRATEYLSTATEGMVDGWLPPPADLRITELNALQKILHAVSTRLIMREGARQRHLA